MTLILSYSLQDGPRVSEEGLQERSAVHLRSGSHTSAPVGSGMSYVHPLCRWHATLSLFLFLLSPHCFQAPLTKRESLLQGWGCWRDDSIIKSTHHSCKEPGFGSQKSHGGSQPPVSPVPGDPLLATTGTVRGIQMNTQANNSCT